MSHGERAAATDLSERTPSEEKKFPITFGLDICFDLFGVFGDHQYAEFMSLKKEEEPPKTHIFLHLPELFEYVSLVCLSFRSVLVLRTENEHDRLRADHRSPHRLRRLRRWRPNPWGCFALSCTGATSCFAVIAWCDPNGAEPLNALSVCVCFE